PSRPPSRRTPFPSTTLSDLRHTGKGFRGDLVVCTPFAAMPTRSYSLQAAVDGAELWVRRRIRALAFEVVQELRDWIHTGHQQMVDRKSTRLNSSHDWLSYAV